MTAVRRVRVGSGQALHWPAHPSWPDPTQERLDALRLLDQVRILDEVRLLEEDDELACVVGPAAREQACRAITARAVAAGAGLLSSKGWTAALGDGPGLLILEGLMACDTCVADRTASELLGGGDLLQPHPPRSEEFLPQTESWRVLAPTRLAVLDGLFLGRAQPWPEVLAAILRRAVDRRVEIDVLRAIASHPRLEERLVLVLWHLASRWGRVEAHGIRLTLPLTHRLIGQIVAAERPSISHALNRLAAAGLVTGSACDLHLHGSLAEHMEALAERHAGVPLAHRG